MTDLPQEAITAAGNAMREKWLSSQPRVSALGLDPMDWAATALKAAAPLIAAAERERISQLAELYAASPTWAAIFSGASALRQFADLLTDPKETPDDA